MGRVSERKIYVNGGEPIIALKEARNPQEAKRWDFFESLRRVEEKAKKPSGRERSSYGDLVATTGWVRVEKDGEEFELKLDKVNRMTNGHYEDLSDVFRRGVGKTMAQMLFGETAGWESSRTSIENLSEYIETLDLLNSALPEPAVSSG